MAKRGDSILGDFEGQLGDYVFKKLRKKKIVVKKGKKKNNHTKPRQRTERLFENVPKMWSGLKRWEKKTWEALIKSGVTFRSSKGKRIEDPMTLFISCNRNLQEADEPVVRTAPQTPVFPETIFGIIFDITLNANGGDMKIFSKMPINEEIKVIIYATSVLTSPSDNTNPRLYRKIEVIDNNFKTGSSVKDKYLKVFEKMPEEMDEISFEYKSVHRKLGTTNLRQGQIVMAKQEKNTQ